MTSHLLTKGLFKLAKTLFIYIFFLSLPIFAIRKALTSVKTYEHTVLHILVHLFSALNQIEPGILGWVVFHTIDSHFQLQSPLSITSIKEPANCIPKELLQCILDN